MPPETTLNRVRQDAGHGGRDAHPTYMAAALDRSIERTVERDLPQELTFLRG